MDETAGREVTRSAELVDGKEAQALLMKGGTLRLGDITGRITMQEVACPNDATRQLPCTRRIPRAA